MGLVADWQEFTSEIVAALAWPVVVLAVVLLLRKQIVELIPGLRRLKLGSLEAEFEGRLGLVVEALEDAVGASVGPGDTAGADDVAVRPVARRQPDLGGVEREFPPYVDITTSWGLLNADAMRAAGRARLKYDEGRQWEALAEAGFISEAVLQQVDRLRELRNVAAHAGETFRPSDAAVRRYMEAVDLVDELLRLIDHPTA